jgi:competence protein ComEC
MAKNSLLKIAVIVFFGGIAVCALLPDYALHWAVFLVPFTVVCFLRRDIGFFRIALIFLLAFLAGLFRYQIAMPEFGPADVAFYRDMVGTTSLEGMIVAEPDIRSDSAYYVVGAERISADGMSLAVSGNVLVKMSRYPEYDYGDRLKLNGRLQSPPVLEGFSYADGLAKNGIWAVMYRPQVSAKPGSGRIDGWVAVFSLKDVISSRIKEIFPEPAAAIAAGVLLGSRSSIPAKTMDDFNATGLTHILAISGYNITLIISIFGFLLGKSGRKSRFIFSTTGIVFFVLLTGMSASVIRAAVMGWFVLLSLFSGRKSSGVQTLLLSAAAMIMVNPRIMLYDMSFQLSFLATLGILLYVPVLEEKATFLERVPAFARESLTVTLAAQVFTVPLMLWRFGRLSLISPLTNIIFLPLIPAIMLFSAVGLASSFLFLPLTGIFSALNWVLSKLLVEGVGFAAALPFASLKTEDFPEWAVLIYYLTALGVAILLRRPRLARYSLPGSVPPGARPSSSRRGTRMKPLLHLS